MKAIFTSDYQSRVLQISFAEGSQLVGAREIAALRLQWLEALKTWHSPYKALIDLTHLEISGPAELLKAELAKLFAFLKGFFLQRAIGYGSLSEAQQELFPFPIYADLDEAKKAVGVRQGRTSSAGEDLRQQLQFDNHFPQRVMELTVNSAVSLDSPEKFAVLKSKLLNNLMQWHSAWTLLIDCSQLEIPAAHHEAFNELVRFFRGFFLEGVLGYGAGRRKEDYPFPLYRARHIASAAVKSDLAQAGDTANCGSRKGKA